MADLPLYVWALVAIGVLAIPATTCVNLYHGAVEAAGDRVKARLVAGTAAAVLGGWMLLSGLLAFAGAYRQDPAVVAPWIGVAIVGAFAGVLLAARIPIIARILAEPGMAPRLIEPEIFRGVGAVFIVVLALGQLPAVFAWPAGFGDIAVGLAAPFVASRLRRAGGGRGALWFNVLGLLDLVVAIATAFLTATGPLQLLPAVPSSSSVVGLLPLALIPTTAVPLAAALHVLSLRRLRTSVSRSTRPVLSGAAG